MDKVKVYIRSDGNSEIGLGHVIRCCALADILRTRFECTFFIRQPSDYIKSEIKRAGCALFEMPVYDSYGAEACEWSKMLTGKEIIVLDGYNFDFYYQQYIKKQNCRLVCIDDIHSYPFLADVIINHSGSAQLVHYTSAFYTQHFLGFKYSLLRKPFLTQRQIVAEGKALLICLGGADPGNGTCKVFERSLVKGFSSIHILIGSGYNYRNELENAVAKSSILTRIYQNLDAESVAELMQRCYYAILSPSSIAIEYMAFGGVVFLHQIADNQEHINQYLLSSGLALDAAEICQLSEADIKQMVEKQARKIDGNSGKRLSNIFLSLATIINGVMESASPNDVSITYKWANETLSRSMSFHHNAILPEEHSSWFASRIKDDQCKYYIFKIDSIPFAQIRFEKKEADYFLSYFIDPGFRGMALGSFVLAEGLRKLQSEIGDRHCTVIGYVKKNNIASCQSFEKLKFKKENSVKYDNAYKYTMKF